MVEAKKNDIENGLGQCVAQMVAARLFNERAGPPSPTVHGCVTSGEVWQFLRLSDDGRTALIDRRRLYLDDVGRILAAFAAILSHGR
jgi:hypothetical protein